MTEEKQLKESQLDGFRERRRKVLAQGGEDALAKQTAKGKLSARERIDLLLDRGTFREIGSFAVSRNPAYPAVPADGVVTGYGNIDGRRVYVFSQDFTCMGGTLSEIQAKKIRALMDQAQKAGCPLVCINDSGGARIQDGVKGLVGYGTMFYRHVQASGIIPQICVIAGPCAGGAVYSPALMDFVFMIKGISYAFITGPRVIRAVMAEEIDEEALGGARSAQEKAGFAARTEENEEECFASVRALLSYLPSSNRERPARVDWGDAPDRENPAVFDVVPVLPSKPYDMHRIIAEIFDKRPDGRPGVFELFPRWATNIITCFARLNGLTVGIIANNPLSRAGCLDIDACDKASRFIRFCDSFNIPIVNLVDVPGYLPGVAQEWGGIIRHGAKTIYAYCEATVPKITLILRKGYGGAYIGMCSRELGADFVFCWPSAELAVMGPEGAVEIIYARELKAAADRPALLREKISEYRDKFANPYNAAADFDIDEVIEPAETRQRLITALEMLREKREETPPRKHGIGPA
ncbi:MAG: carboxyl transferase domain-containing protein [Chloroflexota bacterium]